MDKVAIPFKDSDASMDAETLAMLAGTRPSDIGGGIKLSPVYPGTIALLDLIDSPFVTGRTPAMLDMYRALYVINHGADAVAPVLRARREAEALDAAEGMAETSEAHYRAFLDALRATATGWQEFDAAAARYAVGMGVVSHVELADAIARAINAGTAGFRLIESSPDSAEPAQKKSTCSIASGWLRLWQACLRLVPVCGRMM